MFDGVIVYSPFMNKKKEPKFIYAIRNRPLSINKNNKNANEPSPIHTIGSLSENFILAIAGELHSNSIEAILIEQDQTKMGQFLFSFENKGHLKVNSENVLVCFPLNCQQIDNKFVLTEDDFKKFITEFKSILSNDDSDDSSFSKHSESQQQISLDHKCRGRPKGSKTRKKQSEERSSEEEFFQDSHKKYQQKRGRGRPKGAKNIKKNANEELPHEFDIFQMFANLFENKSIEEVNTKINRLKERDERQNPLIKKEEFEGDENIKRSRGRPKGVKNKPKIHNEESESEQTLQIETLPKRKPIKNQAIKCCNKCYQRDLKRMFLDGKNVDISELRNVCQNLGVEDQSNLVINAIKQGHEEELRKLLKQKDKIENNFIISWVTNSRLEQASYTVRTRKEYISKNRREGIHALIQDCFRPYHYCWWKILGVERILESIPNSKASIDIYNLLIEDEEELKKQISMNLATLIRNGNQTLSCFLMQKVLKDEENTSIYGYSKDHLECFNKKRNQIQFKKLSMLKQNFTANFCSPIHCATINSNLELLSYILKHISEFNVGDSMNRKPIHYASVLESSKALEILVKFGADLKDIDKKKMTPLMLAAQAGRPKNVKYILERVRDGQYINFKGDEGVAAIHLAVIGKHHECVSILLEDTLVDREIETKEGMNIVHLAAGTGQKEMLKNLLDAGVSLEPDQFRRTALMVAIRNHQNDIFFHLFTHTDKYYKRDYSYNTLLHYSAAYGNLEVVKYLLDINMNQTMNRKSFYPFEIAILKGHFQCAKLLQNWTLHYSQHLLNRILKCARGTSEFYEIFEYLLETRKYDLNYRNPMAGGNTCLHFLCSISADEYDDMRRNQSAFVLPHQFDNMMKKIISKLLQYGADPSLENDRGEKPVTLCIERQNLIGIQLLLQQIPFDHQYSFRNHHFVYYLTNIACMGKQEMKFVYQKIITVDQKILKVQLKKTDSHGFQFLIYLIKNFTEVVHENFRKRFKQHRQRMKEQGEMNGVVESGEVVNKSSVLKAFQDYIEHEEYLIKTINFLVEIGADPRFVVSQPKMEKEHQNYKKWGIQHFLMRFPSLNLLKIFMKWIDTNFNMQNSEGKTPLHLFCISNKEGSLFNNYSPEHDCLPQINYSEMKNFEGRRCLEYLLENGLTSNVLDINRSTPLLYAAINGQLGFISLLRFFGSTINNVNSLNEVPIIEIIKRQKQFSLEQLERTLSDEGLKPDFRDANDRNALHHLIANATNFDHSVQVCLKLMKYGVNINTLDKFGRSPIFYCFIRIEDKESHLLSKNYLDTEHIMQSQNDKVQILQALLNHPEVNLNILDAYQRTPLHYACENKFFFSIIYLLDKNVNHDVMDCEGNTPLAICLRHRNLNQAAVLIKKGVKYGHVIDHGCKYSYFRFGIDKLSVGICFMLIDNGYPFERALEEVPNQAFRRILLKKYNRE